MELPFAAVHQLCAPDRVSAGHAPGASAECSERRAGSVAGDPPDRFLVALAVLSLLSAVAEERPLLCVVDDAQWLDGASNQVLGFVARRLLAESVAIVFAIREPGTGRELRGLPEARLAGLEEGDARALLARTVAGRLDDEVRDRVVAETRGNPLALLELPWSMSAAELAGGFELPATETSPVTSRTGIYGASRALPEDTQHLLVLAAADPVGDATLVWRAAETLGIGAGALAPAEDAELLQIGERVRFRHPLVRSAVNRAAPLADRQRVHRALAEVSDPELDADRRAWHGALRHNRARTRTWPPSSSARRGAHRRAAGSPRRPPSYERSVELTPDAGRRSDARWPPLRPACTPARSTWPSGCSPTAEAGPLDGLGARPGGPAARSDRLRLGLGQRRAPAPAGGRQAARAAGPRAGARDLSERLGAAMFAGSAAAGDLRRAGRAAQRAATARGRAARRRRAPGRARTAVHRRTTLPRPRAARARGAFSGDDLPIEDACDGAGWPRRPATRSGTTTVAGRLCTPDPARPGRGRARQLPMYLLAVQHGRRSPRRASRRRSLDRRRPRRSTEATGARLAPYTAGGAGASGKRARRRAADRGDDRAGGGPGTGPRGGRRATGRRRSSTTASDATRRR